MHYQAIKTWLSLAMTSFFVPWPAFFIVRISTNPIDCNTSISRLTAERSLFRRLEISVIEPEWDRILLKRSILAADTTFAKSSAFSKLTILLFFPGGLPNDHYPVIERT